MEKTIYNGKFILNDKGEIFSKNKKLKTYIRKDYTGQEYEYIQININKKQTKIRMDKLVYETFKTKIKNFEILLKKDKENNIENLYVEKIYKHLIKTTGIKWKCILNNEYFISEYGDIYSLRNKILMKNFIDRNGYKYISIRQKGKEKKYKIHRLVALAYIPNPENKPTVNHITGDKTKNHYSVLEWATVSENTKHAFDNKLAIPNKKTVLQFDINGNFIQTFDSVTKAAKITKTNINRIILCCKNKAKTTNGFIWKYEQV